MQVIGNCRFSYSEIRGFQIEQGSIDARLKCSYAKNWKEQKFRIYETITHHCYGYRPIRTLHI